MQRRSKSARRGFTLIELAMALGIAALATASALMGVSALTDAHLRSTAIELSGAVKASYDRAIMQRRTQRLALDLDKGLWWFEYTEDPFALSQERQEGEVGERNGTGEKEERRGRYLEEKTEVEKLIDGSALSFAPDAEIDDGKPRALPSDVHFARVWTGHQEDWFTSGIAYVHFFRGGYTEPAIIELEDEGEDVTSLEVLPLTGRVKTSHVRLKLPDIDEPDGRDEGD